MRFSKKELRDIYDRTSGRCHLCHSRRAIRNYGKFGAKGAWEVEHSRAQAIGGTHRFNNLYVACISCNRSKGAKPTRSVRARYGLARAPLSKQARQAARAENAVGAGALGVLLGVPFGPVGMWIGAALGATLGYDENPDHS
jgi:5-methylcytosine-specific restriction endonuclease McrA